MKNQFDTVDRYGLLYLPRHLIDLERWNKLTGILCDLEFVEKKCASDMVFELIEDYQVSLDSLPELQVNNKFEHRRKRQTAQYTERLMKFAEQKSKKLVPIKSIDLVNPRKTTGENASTMDQSSRSKRLRAFLQFLNEQQHDLDLYANIPGFTAQQAYNFVSDEFLGLVAEKQLKSFRSSNTVFLLHSHESRPEHALNRSVSRILKEHSGDVRSVAVAVDGLTAVSGGEEGSLHVWNLASGRCRKKLHGHTNVIGQVGISADGHIAVSSSWDKTIRIWDTTNFRCLNVIGPFDHTHRSVKITPSGRKLVVCDDDKLTIWYVEKDGLQQLYEKRLGSVRAMAITADATLVIFTCDGQRVQVLNVEQDSVSFSFRMHEDQIRALAITPDGRTLACGSEDYTASVWDLPAGKCLSYLDGHMKEVVAVSLSHDGKITASASWDHTIRIWETLTGRCLHVFEGHSDYIEDLALSADGHLAISASDDRTVRIWDVERGLVSPSEKKLPYWPGTTARSADGRIEISGRQTSVIEVTDMATEKVIRKFGPLAKPIAHFSISGGGDVVFAADRFGHLQAWIVPSGLNLFDVQGQIGGVWDLSISYDGNTAVTAGKDEKIKIWNLKSGECLTTIEYEALTIAMSRDGSFFITGSDDERFRLWSVRLSACIRSMDANSGMLRVIALSPDSDFALTGGRDNTIRVWELSTGNCIGICSHRSEPVSMDIWGRNLKVGDWGQNVTFFEFANMEICKPFNFCDVEAAFEQQMKLDLDLERKKLAKDITRMKYRIQVYDYDGQIKFHGQSETFEDYTYRNCGPLSSLKELLEELDGSLQNAADSHRKMYRVDTFEIHPKGVIGHLEERTFKPKKIDYHKPVRD